MYQKLISAFAVALMLAACATSTPYAPASSEKGYGFSEQRIEDNRYRIMFRGNSSTTRETVENFLLYRAAELTMINGYDYFVVVEGDTEARRSYTSTGDPFFGPAFYGRSGFGGRGFRGRGFRGGYGFPYYAYGFGWGSPYAGGVTREITRYSAVAFITMHKGPKPEEDAQAFDARDVSQNLRPLVVTPTDG